MTTFEIFVVAMLTVLVARSFSSTQPPAYGSGWKSVVFAFIAIFHLIWFVYRMVSAFEEWLLVLLGW